MHVANLRVRVTRHDVERTAAQLIARTDALARRTDIAPELEQCLRQARKVALMVVDTNREPASLGFEVARLSGMTDIHMAQAARGELGTGFGVMCVEQCLTAYRACQERAEAGTGGTAVFGDTLQEIFTPTESCKLGYWNCVAGCRGVPA